MNQQDSPFDNLVIDDNPVLEVSRSEQTLEADLASHMQHYKELPDNVDPVERARLVLDIAECHLGLDQQIQAHDWCKQVFNDLVKHQQWQLAVDACDIIYNADQEDALSALGNGIWLAVTFPIDANLTVQMLHHIVEETPDDSDGAAVTAMLAHYIAETRAEEKDLENLTFLTNQILAQVAKRHRGIEDQQTIQTWIKMYELDDIRKLLPRLATILDAIVDNDWWYDKDEIRRQLPVN